MIALLQLLLQESFYLCGHMYVMIATFEIMLHCNISKN